MRVALRWVAIILAVLALLAAIGATMLAIWEPEPPVHRIERVIPNERLGR